MLSEYITNEYTARVQKVVREIQADPATYLGARYLPAVTVDTRRIFVDVIEASGGVTNEHVPGTNPLYIAGTGTRVQEYSPPFYKEAIHYDENKILWLRDLGNNGQNVRGVQSFMERDIARMNLRIENRMEKQRWDVIFNGGFTYLGKTVSFGVPTSNRVVPVGAAWSTDGINANQSANPILDLRYWLMGGLAGFRKYNVNEIVMNPNTARWILENNNTKSFLASFAANPAFATYDVNTILKMFAPGIPNVTIYNGWYQTETTVNGKITVSDAIYFIPDGYIWFKTSLPGNETIGEFVQTIHLAGGTINEPASGKFLVIDDCTGPGTAGGPKNPYVDIVAGVYGGVKLDRPFDLLTAKVIP